MSDDDKYVPTFIARAREPEPEVSEESLPEAPAHPLDRYLQPNSLHPTKPLDPRLKRVCQLFAKGLRNKDIAEQLNYTEGRISIIKHQPRVQREIAKLQDRLFERDTDDRIKSMLPDALDALEEILTDPNLEASKKENAAKWLLEKATGKPAQQVHTTGDFNISGFLDLIHKTREEGHIIDVTNKQTETEELTGEVTEAAEPEAPEKDELADWVAKNLD